MQIADLDELIELINENKTFRFKIKAVAGSKLDLIDFSEEFIKVKIKERAIEGKANKAIVNFLAKSLNLPKSKIKILNGEKAAIKTIQVSL